MRIFFTTKSLKKYIIKEAPTLQGVWLNIENYKLFYIVQKRKLLL